MNQMEIETIKHESAKAVFYGTEYEWSEMLDNTEAQEREIKASCNTEDEMREAWTLFFSNMLEESRWEDGNYRRVYGNDLTELDLTEKAEIAYNATDPLHIIERKIGKNYLYDLEGVIKVKDLASGHLIELLEAEADEIMKERAEDEEEEN